MNNPIGHYWGECPMCGPMVFCGKCGNNCCNGGYGTLANGNLCDGCESAYEIQNNPDEQWRYRLQAIEAGTAKTGRLGPTDESAVAVSHAARAKRTLRNEGETA